MRPEFGLGFSSLTASRTHYPPMIKITNLSRYVVGALTYFSFIALVWAGVTYVDFLHDLAMTESSMKPSAMNGPGYAGLFQLGEAALIDAGYYIKDGTKKNDWQGSFTGKNGINSLSDFKNNPDAQVKAVVDYQKQSWKVIQSLGLDKYIGKTINGVQITQSGLIAGAHLVGYGGLKSYLSSNGTIIPKDGNETAITSYIKKLGGYTIDLSSPAPSYAAITSAPGGSGMPSVNTPPPSPPTGETTGPVPSSPIAPPPMGSVLPDEAFFSNTGYPPGTVSEAIKMIVAGSLFMWLVWVILGTWKGFNEGRIAIAQFKIDIFRASIILSVGIVLITP